MTVEELLHHVESTGASQDDPLIKALHDQLEEYFQREADRQLDQPAWRLRERALKDDLAIAREERDRMCRWAFGAAIDRLNEGLAVLASPTGPKSAKEFDHNWCWLDFATQEMTALRDRFLGNLGRLEWEAKCAISETMPMQRELFNAEEGPDGPQKDSVREARQFERQQPDLERHSSPSRRFTKAMRTAIALLQQAQADGRPMLPDELERALKGKVDRTTAKTTPGKLLGDGYVTRSADGTLSPVNAWRHLAK